MDPDKTEENGGNDAADDQNDLFPEISDYKPEELDLDFLSSQERPGNLFPPIPEQKAPPASSTPQSAPLPPPQSRTRRAPPAAQQICKPWPSTYLAFFCRIKLLSNSTLPNSC